MFATMATEPIITNKGVDDIPILLTQIERMGVQPLIDKNFRHTEICKVIFKKLRDNILLGLINQCLLALCRIYATPKIAFYANLTLK